MSEHFRETDVEVEVRKEDQQKINKFGIIFRSIDELKGEKAEVEEQLAALEDAEQEIMLADNNDIFRIKVGTSYISVDEDEFNNFLEKKKEQYDRESESIVEKLGELEEERDSLKRDLKSRFGDTINLEA